MPSHLQENAAPKGDKAKGVSKDSSELSPWPDYIESRLVLWEKYKKRYEYVCVFCFAFRQSKLC